MSKKIDRILLITATVLLSINIIIKLIDLF